MAKTTMGYPENILEYAVINKLCPDIDKFEEFKEKFKFSSDQLKGFYYVLMQLSNTEVYIMETHMKDEVTFSKIASDMGVSKERVHQIFKRAVSKLMKHGTIEYVLYGYDTWLNMESDTYINNVPMFDENCNTLYKEPIEVLKLSCHAEEMLHSAGAFSIRQLIDLIYDGYKIHRIHTISPSDQNDLIIKLKSLGILEMGTEISFEDYMYDEKTCNWPSDVLARRRRKLIEMDCDDNDKVYPYNLIDDLKELIKGGHELDSSIDNELLKGLSYALSELPVDESSIISMTYNLNMTPYLIAGILKIGESTVEEKQLKALMTLAHASMSDFIFSGFTRTRKERIKSSFFKNESITELKLSNDINTYLFNYLGSNATIGMLIEKVSKNPESWYMIVPGIGKQTANYINNILALNKFSK